MPFIKHQVQEISGTEYEYYYIYESYYTPEMDNPTNFKVGKVGDSPSDLASSYKEKAESKGLDISKDEVEEFRQTVEEAQENAEEDENIAEYIEDQDKEEDDETESKDYRERSEQHALVTPVKVSWSGKTREKVRSDMQHVEILDPVFESQKTNIVVETEEQVNELLFRLHGKIKAEGEVWSTNNQKAIKRVHHEIVEELEDQGYIIENHKIEDLDESEDSSKESNDGFSEKVEDNIEKIDRKVGDVLSDYQDWSMSRDGNTFTVEGDGAELKIEVREDYYALYGSDLEEMVSDIGFRGVHDVKKDGDKYLRKYGSNHDVQDFVRYHGGGESIDAGSAGLMSDRIINNNLDKVSTESLKDFYEMFTEGDREEYTDTLAYALVINPDWAGEKVDDEKLEWMKERREAMGGDLLDVKIELGIRGVEVEDYKDFKEPLPEKGQVIRWEDDEVFAEDPDNSSESQSSDEDDGMDEDAVKKLTSKGAMVEKDGAEILTEDDVEVIESLDVTPMFVSETMIRKLREQDHDVSGNDDIEIEEDGDVEYRKVRFISESPAFTGIDLETYGGFDDGDEAELPEDNAEILINRGMAEDVEDESQSKHSGSEENDETSEENTSVKNEDEDSTDIDDGYVRVEFLQKTPQFMGTDLESYGGFEERDVAVIPEDNAEILENRGNVEVKKGMSNDAEEYNQSSTNTSGQGSSSERDFEGKPDGFGRLRDKVMNWISENETEDSGAMIDDLTSGSDGIMEWAEFEGFSEDDVMDALDSLKREGQLFEPGQGRIKTI